MPRCVESGQIMHDGTKIRAQAGADTFRREKSLKEHLERARQAVKEMGDPRAEVTRRNERRDSGARTEESDLRGVAGDGSRAGGRNGRRRKSRRVRVNSDRTGGSTARMKHGDNAIAPSYNAQISTDAQNKIIVGAHLSQSSSDAQSLMPAIEKVKENLGREPAQMVVDGGFTNRGSIVACAEEDRPGGIVAGPGGEKWFRCCSVRKLTGMGPPPSARGSSAERKTNYRIFRRISFAKVSRKR